MRSVGEPGNGTWLAQDGAPPDLANGSIASFLTVGQPLPVYPITGYHQTGPVGLFRAKLRHRAAHSITSSARASNWGGVVIPSAFAVFELMTSSNLVGCSIGRSPGFAPCNILSTYSVARAKLLLRSLAGAPPSSRCGSNGETVNAGTFIYQPVGIALKVRPR